MTLDFPGLNPSSLLWSRLRLLWALSGAFFRSGSIPPPRCEIQLLESFDLQFFTSEASALAGLALAPGPDLTLELWVLGRGLQARAGGHVEGPFPGVPGVGGLCPGPIGTGFSPLSLQMCAPGTFSKLNLTLLFPVQSQASPWLLPPWEKLWTLFTRVFLFQTALVSRGC